MGYSVVYINQGTNNTFIAMLYVIATCDSLLFSKVKATSKNEIQGSLTAAAESAASIEMR
jgi:hypothetical protein